MRFIAVSCFCVLTICTFLGVATADATPPTTSSVVDPLFGLRVDADQGSFERLHSLSSDCPAVATSSQWSRDAWLFGKVSETSGDILLIGGLFNRKKGKPILDRIGAIVRVSKTGCELIGPASEPFEDSKAYSSVISAQELTALAQDATARLEKGFGGKAGLHSAARLQHVNLQPTLKPALAQAMSSR